MDEDFSYTESVMSTHSASLKQPVLSEAERQAMRQFCLVSLKLKQAQDEVKAERKTLAASVKTNKAKLADWIREQGKGGRCFTLPRELYRSAERSLSGGGLPPPPPYLRLSRNTTDAAITPAIAETAIMDFDKDAYAEIVQDEKTKPNPTQALIKTIVDAVRASIRTFRESVTLSQSLEKGVKPIEIDEVPEEVGQSMVQLHTAQQQAKAKSAALKERTTDVSSTVKRLQPTVGTVLEKTGRNTQQVQLEGVAGRHRIVKRVSARAPKVTLTVFEQCLSEIIATTAKLDTSDPDKLLKTFTPNVRKDIVKRVQLKLSALPKKESVSIKLQSVAERAGEDESEDDAEDS